MHRTMLTNKKYQGTAMAAVKKVAHKTRVVGLDSQDFSPSLLCVQLQPLYGMVDRQVAHLSANATDNTQQGAGQSVSPTAKSLMASFAFRALVDLKAQEVVDGVRCLEPGHASDGKNPTRHQNHLQISAVARDGRVSEQGMSRVQTKK
jgi:hypothetical protein